MPLTHNSDSLETRNLTVHDVLMLGESTTLELSEMASPVAPPPGSLALFAKTGGKLHVKDSTGAEVDLADAPHEHAAGAITSGTLDGDRLASKNRTITKTVYVESPHADDTFPFAFISDPVTLVAVRGVTDDGTVDFNIEHRDSVAPGVPGIDTLASELQATDTGAMSTTFADATVPGDRWLTFVASAVGGSPGRLWVALVYTVD